MGSADSEAEGVVSRSAAWGWRRGRRSFMKAGVAAALTTGAGVVAGCASATRPTAVSQRIPLVFQAAAHGAYRFALPSQWPTAKQLLMTALSPFLAKYPGIDLKLTNIAVDPVTAILAGTGPDIVQIESRAGLIQQGYLLDLSSYIKKSNLDVQSLYAGGSLGVAGSGGRVYALPYYTETTAMVVNLGILNQLGLDDPPAQWDYIQWADWARRVAVALPAAGGKGKTPAYATTIMSVAGLTIPAGFYFAGWGGAIADPSDPGRCLLDSAASVACGEFLFPLMIEGVAPPLYSGGGQMVPAEFVSGHQVSAVDQQGFALRDAMALGSVEWKYFPMPTWPKGAYNFTNANLVGISVASKHADAAWELLQWISTDPAYERVMMHATLYPPALRALQAEWVGQVHAVAPVMVGKNVEVFAQMAAQSTLVPEFGTVFRASETQALSIISSSLRTVLDQKASVPFAFQQAAKSVNALEEVAVQRASAAVAAKKTFPVVGPSVAQVAPAL